MAGVLQPKERVGRAMKRLRPAKPQKGVVRSGQQLPALFVTICLASADESMCNGKIGKAGRSR